VTLVSVGSEASAETLRAGLALGADQGVLLKSDQAPEGLAVATALAHELRQRTFDIVLFGFKAIDDDLQAVGPMVAQLLDVPAVTGVAEFTVAGETVVAQREVEGGIEVVELRTPCALSMTKGPHAPRYASLKGIMAAKKKPLEEKVADLGPQGVRTIALEYPPERKGGQILTGGADSVPDLLRLLHEEARIL
jgi:electron transfer flavoprotein beta subunit